LDKTETDGAVSAAVWAGEPEEVSAEISKVPEKAFAAA